MDLRDRISELPDFILHEILSILDTKEACRATVLSKRWFGVWSSIPVLDFWPRYFIKKRYGFRYDDHSAQYFVGFIDKTMQRYSLRKYRITKLKLKLNFDIPMTSEQLQSLVDECIGIAVQNQVEELDIWALDCVLPDVLFNAKSLKVLKCGSVNLPYYETMNLISLEHFTLTAYNEGNVDEDMLQRIISFCPLAELHIQLGDRKKISLPWTREVNKRDECFGSGTIQSELTPSPLRKFFYSGLCGGLKWPWPWNVNVVALKNLKKLEIQYAAITDDIVSELAFGLVALQSLVLSNCSKLKCIKMSSVSLMEFRIEESFNLGHLTKATIDAPNLLEFWFNCEVEVSLSLIRVSDHCNAHFLPSVKHITKLWYSKLKKFLVETNLFEYLVMDPIHSEIMNKGELRDAITGSPYKLKELKLRRTSAWPVLDSSLMAFLDGLFLCCHPDVLSMTPSLHDKFAETILGILESKVKCWNDPLKSIEIEGVDCSSLLSRSPEFEIMLRLTWSSVEP